MERDGVALRPIEEADLAALLRFRWDAEAVGDYQWFGFRVDDARALERRWHHDGLIGSDRASFLAVVAAGGACSGWVTWKPLPFGNVEIGVGLFPEYRGRGIGTAAHRLLVDYVFATTTAHRAPGGDGGRQHRRAAHAGASGLPARRHPARGRLP